MPPPHPTRAASRNPAVRYRLPQDILDDTRLSHAEMASLLAEWALDLEQASAATDEGMATATTGSAARDVTMQQRIAAAQGVLEIMAAETPPTSPDQDIEGRGPG